ncbi:MAG: hypothetical protein ACQEWD_01100 [Bacteroidota bacterium]|uniref:Beta-lactamase-inhibitor-like, PepSY-like n=1 Tax=Salegentibacter flavus TaxID=287099 RepID=A0A1I4XM94_9FLAO|nr:hypothetical protein [Salegentibacter flavus]SFN26390.1 hypothetical protein SAMN05660413_00122 [Salegentibacter flavus]
MKKLGLSLLAVTAMFFYTENVNAQVDGDVDANVEVEAHAQEKTDFKEIDVLALPQPVKDAVMTDFNGAVTEEAWVKEKDGKTMYKLSLNVEGEKKKVYIDQDGNWIDKKDKDK